MKKAEINVGSTDQFTLSKRLMVGLDDGSEIGVFLVDSSFVAYENVCPHMGGPVCQGRLLGRTDEIFRSDQTSAGLTMIDDRPNIVCPWHGYEFDVGTGIHQGSPAIKLRPLDVRVEAGDVIVQLPHTSGRRGRIPGTVRS
jgi:nitrite reductase/ring-hydroxylating ferredoxin subunit